jgi:hypothetical protein
MDAAQLVAKRRHLVAAAALGRLQLSFQLGHPGSQFLLPSQDVLVLLLCGTLLGVALLHVLVGCARLLPHALHHVPQHAKILAKLLVLVPGLLLLLLRLLAQLLDLLLKLVELRLHALCHAVKLLPLPHPLRGPFVQLSPLSDLWLGPSLGPCTFPHCLLLFTGSNGGEVLRPLPLTLQVRKLLAHVTHLVLDSIQFLLPTVLLRALLLLCLPQIGPELLGPLPEFFLSPKQVIHLPVGFALRPGLLLRLDPHLDLAGL